MQAATAQVKDQIWVELQKYFNNYKNQSGQLSIEDLDLFIVDILKEVSQAQRDYVLKNHFRLDVDNSGLVSFIELGNFLFKRHCCQMSLQRKHRTGKIINGADRKLTVQEFIELINEAYKFLHVSISNEVATFIFNSIKSSNENLITYAQYFKAIEVFICKQSKPVDPNNGKNDKDNNKGIERNSKLRNYIWTTLRKLYNAYALGRTLQSNDKQMRGLLFAIVGDLSDNDVIFIASGLNKLNYKVISFETFAGQFIYLIGQLGLSKFAINRQSSRRSLNKDEFVRLLRSSYSFLNLDTFKTSILHKIFAKIDKNNDGLISYDEYLDWVRRFLSVDKYYGDQFYVSEDDEEVDPSDPFDRPIINPKAIIKFVFDDYSFAKLVRARTLELLKKYDQKHKYQFYECEIKQALLQIMKQTEIQLQYVVKNVFRYDRNNDGAVTYYQLTNFCVQLHFGELAIQRLHKTNKYSKGNKRIMNRQQFGQTVNYPLNYIGLKATQELLDTLFKVIDLDHDGWISYQVYFAFLRYYFGALSVAALDTINERPPQSKEIALNQDQLFLSKLKQLDPFSRFSRIIIDQLKNIFFRYDYNKNLVFQYNETRDILEKVFELDTAQLSYILMKYFTFDAEKGGSLTFDELISLILTIYYSQIIFRRKFNTSNSKAWGGSKIDLKQFIAIFTEGTFFIRLKPSIEDLTFIFNDLDTDKDGFITFNQYINFIKKYLGDDIDLSGSKYTAELSGVTQQELNFVQRIWDELKEYFDRYDNGKKGHLCESELKSFIIQVLQETSERELNYVFWNLFRVDTNSNKEVDFLEFAPFILNHAGEISLQRFHKYQTAGKNCLEDHEFYQVLSNAYSFLSSIPKQKKIINSIYDRVRGTAQFASYAAYLNWIHCALAAKYKK